MVAYLEPPPPQNREHPDAPLRVFFCVHKQFDTYASSGPIVFDIKVDVPASKPACCTLL